TTDLLMQGKSLSDLDNVDRRFTLRAEDIALVNPNTQTCPIFKTRRDAEITKAVYRRIPILVTEAPLKNSWGAFYLRLVDYGDHARELIPLEIAESEGFQERNWVLADDRGEVLLPVLESKLVNQFDLFATRYTRASTVEDVAFHDKNNPNLAQKSRF